MLLGWTCFSAVSAEKDESPARPGRRSPPAPAHRAPGTARRNPRVESRRAMAPVQGVIAMAMTWLPSAPCACGQPWEAHELRCQRQKRQGVGRVVALAVAGGVAVQVLFVVAIVFAAGLISPPLRSIGLPGHRYVVAGPVQPRVQACELFYAWEKTHNPSLLNRAVADAHSSRVPWQVKPRFISVLSGLRRWTWEGAHSPRAISFEHAVQVVCKQQVTSDLN